MRSPNTAGNALSSAGAAAAGGLGLQKRQKKQVPQFAGLFSDGAGFGIEMVQALEAVQLKLSLPFGLSQAALRSRMPVLSL